MLVFCCMSNGYWELGLRFEWLALIIFEFSDSKVLTCSWKSWQVLFILLMWLAENLYILRSHTFALFYKCVCAYAKM